MTLGVFIYWKAVVIKQRERQKKKRRGGGWGTQNQYETHICLLFHLAV